MNIGRPQAESSSTVQSSKSGGFFFRSKLSERRDGGLHQRDWIVGAVGFGENIVDATRFADCSNGLAGDDTGTSSGRNEGDTGRPELAPHLVGDAAFDKRHS